MLSVSRLIGFVPTTNPEEAIGFFRDKLGLPVISQDAFAIVFNSNGTPLRVSIVREVTPVPYTTLGWEVADVHATVAALTEAGIVFLKFGFPGQEANGVWTAPDGSQVAWFNDPEGNILSLSRHASAG